MFNTSVCLAIESKGLYLCIERAFHKVQAGALYFPGGGVELEDSAINTLKIALKREIQEELSLEIDDLSCLEYITSSQFMLGDQPALDTLFYLDQEDIDKTLIKPDTREIKQVDWLDVPSIFQDKRSHIWFKRLVAQLLVFKKRNHSFFDFDLNPDQGELSSIAYQLGILTFADLMRFIWALPYGRNADPKDYRSCFFEGRGTCSTKHGLIKAIAREYQANVDLKMGICKLDTELVESSKTFLQSIQKPYFPEAHCYLEIENKKIDLTFKDQQPLLKATVLEEYTIEPEDIRTKKIEIHHSYLKNWLNDNDSFDEIWKKREQWIQSLSHKGAV